MDKSFHSVYSSNFAMGETEQLYTARGEQGMGTLQSLADKIGVVAKEDTWDSLLRWHYTEQNDRIVGKKESY